MKRFVTVVITLIISANMLPMGALAACGHGGYRPPIRPYHGSHIQVYRQPAVQRVIRQQIVTQPRIRRVSPQSQIRIAPSQRARLAANQPRQVRIPQGREQLGQQAQAPPVQPSNPPVASNNNANANTNSALSMLAGQQQPTSPSPAPSVPAATATAVAKHVGTWTAAVGNDATVQLNLQEDGSFLWVATKNGKQSQFDGHFTIADGTLTLARASDNQKLAGSLTFTGSGFNFKLNGAKDSGLNFTQQS